APTRLPGRRPRRYRRHAVREGGTGSPPAPAARIDKGEAAPATALAWRAPDLAPTPPGPAQVRLAARVRSRLRRGERRTRVTDRAPAARAASVVWPRPHSASELRPRRD